MAVRVGTILRRKRGLIFKVIIAIPVLWFSFIGFIVVISGNSGIDNQGDPRDVNPRFNRDQAKHVDAFRTTSNLPVKPGEGSIQHKDQPVIEPPNFDRMRLEQRMKEQAADELKQKEQERHQKKVQEDIERSMQEQPMNPFHDHILNPQNRTQPRPHDNIVRDPNAPGKKYIQNSIHIIYIYIYMYQSH